MAIQIAYSTDNDDYPIAYARIDEINTHYGRKTAHMVVSYYKTRAAANNGKRPLGDAVFDFGEVAQVDENGVVIVPPFDDVFGVAKYRDAKTDPKKLGYLFLKTQAAFAAGEDVMEAA